METETKLIQFIQKEVMLERVQTQQDVELCMTQNKRAKAMVDWAESMRTEATRPILASKKAIDDLWKLREAPLLALITHNKQNLEAYLFEQEKQKATELKEETGFSNKESTNLAKIETKQESGVTYRTDWEIEITDIEKVPAKYIIKSVDEKLIKEYLKEGKKSIPGLSCVEKKIIITK
jgi:hypothetical protein